MFVEPGEFPPTMATARRSWNLRRVPSDAVRSLTQLLGATAFALATAAAYAQPLLDQADAVRLLEQSTFGPTDALVAHVQTVGVNGWLAEQFAAPPSQYPAFPYVPNSATVFCATDPNPQCPRDNYSLFQLQNEFFRNALTGRTSCGSGSPSRCRRSS